MKASELTDAALDWAVAKCEGRKDNDFGWWWDNYKPSTDWAQGGPIIEREWITVAKPNNTTGWVATLPFTTIDCELDMEREYGPTPLIAAMRCYVASKLGDEIEIPEELK